MSAQEKQKLSEEEFKKLQEINQRTQSIMMELGSLELQKISIENVRENLKNLLKENQSESQKFIEDIKGKYGDISINITTGEFEKAPENMGSN